MAGRARERSLLDVLRQEVQDIIIGCREGLDIWDRYEALSRLSNQELAQRGLARDDVSRVANSGDDQSFAQCAHGSALGRPRLGGRLGRAG